MRTEGLTALLLKINSSEMWHSVTGKVVNNIPIPGLLNFEGDSSQQWTTQQTMQHHVPEDFLLQNNVLLNYGNLTFHYNSTFQHWLRSAGHNT